MTDSEKKEVQTQFNQKFLEMSNCLGGSPIALLRGSDAVDKIQRAKSVLDDLSDMACSYHEYEQESDVNDSPGQKTDSNK